MIGRIRIPIRVKFMLTFMVLVSLIVGIITFTTANLFSKDKKAYVNGLTSMVVLGAAEEAHSLLTGYQDRLRLYARLILHDDMLQDEREELIRALFEEFPELVGVEIARGEEEPVEVYNVALLDAASLTRDDLRLFQDQHPLSFDVPGSGEPFVRNSTVTEQLPCFTLAFQQSSDIGITTVSAVLLVERLQHLMGRFSAYEQSLVDSEGNALAHSDAEYVTSRKPVILPTEVSAIPEEFSAGLTLEYEQGDTRMIGGFASVDFGKVVAAVQIPRSAAHLASRELISRLLIVAALLLVAAIVSAVVWAHRITRPMERLSDATRTIAKGSFDIEVEAESTDELGDLANSFNQMAGELMRRDDQLKETHQQLVQSEKLAAFGQLGAGIAHEVKNPLAGILSCAQLATDEVEEGSQAYDDLKLIEKETRRCKSIIDNLLKFARQENAEMAPTQINTVIEDSIAIVNHQMALNEVEVEMTLHPDLPCTRGNANQLQQVIMNLLINAQQAMSGAPGSIHVTSRSTGDGEIEVRITDTGPGIPEDIRWKVFEPFFTTKPTGEGTGLGLSVTFGIVKDHDGEIEVESEIGKGTTFSIVLPATEERAQL